jgi:hypothetical protein
MLHMQPRVLGCQNSPRTPLHLKFKLSLDLPFGLVEQNANVVCTLNSTHYTPFFILLEPLMRQACIALLGEK